MYPDTIIINCVKLLEKLLFKLTEIIRYVFLTINNSHLIDFILWFRGEFITYRSSWFDAPPS